MKEKVSSDLPETSRDEHVLQSSETSEPVSPDGRGRRESVALNIIENPLKVSNYGLAQLPSPISVL